MYKKRNMKIRDLILVSLILLLLISIDVIAKPSETKRAKSNWSWSSSLIRCKQITPEQASYYKNLQTKKKKKTGKRQRKSIKIIYKKVWKES